MSASTPVELSGQKERGTDGAGQPPKEKSNSIISYLWRASLSVILFIIALQWVDFDELKKILRNPRIDFLVLYLLLTVADRLMMAYKWSILLKAKRIRLRFMYLVAVYYKGTFVGNLLPSSLGGDAIRAYELTKVGCRQEDAISSIAMERFIGLLSALVLALCGLASARPLGVDLPLEIVFPLVMLLAGGVVFLLTVFLGGPAIRARMAFIERFSLARKAFKIAGSFTGYRYHAGSLLTYFLLTFIEQLLPIVQMYLLACILHLGVDFRAFIAIIPITQFVARIPISLSGIGLQENLLMGFFSLTGVATTASFALGVASNLGAIITGLPGAYFYYRTPEAERAAPSGS